ncbi:NADH-quinone oxidoreductase subunit M [Ferruginibacter paludis]|uniref:complex I subunit 4 family protein n=1 Tax=Ferruginibacter paludis TaxID=1310417 RepID=UPI0025B567EC|nr:NADH-quinone oxidoreductase subunit M [Ferruginibacter paludis]MDN3654558.1 NADH-quinone oxidoreductase subunit M [Ferruginibacter paludis]
MDQDISITFPHVLIFFPLVAGLITFFFKKDATVKSWALFSSVITLCVSLGSIYYANNKALSGLTFNYEWLKYIGASFSVSLDGMGRILTLLTAISFPVIFVATYKSQYKNTNSFYGLLLLTQAGLMGVFLASDALLFYFFWELAIIPVYFLCSKWGGDKRIQATFKFFIYTFTGSLLMLVGIIYIYLQTAATQDATGKIISAHSFAINYFYAAQLTADQQSWLFWLFFIAFAIKMPVFPFHTWQPDTYEQSPSAVTMVLSGVMVKMGLFGVVRWLLPMFPLAVAKFDTTVIILSVIGIVYASLLAIKQDDLKRLVAYSSIAHIGLMSATIFTTKQIGLEGVMIQMFNHGINIIGLWIVIEMIERQLGVRKISQLSGIAHKAPVLTIMLVVIGFANIALPLTNAFVGEFMMFSGLFQFNGWIATVALVSIILAAVYTLTMVQKVFYGQVNALTTNMKEISVNEQVALSIIVVAIFLSGIYPQPLFDLTKDTVTGIITRFK